MSDKIVPRKAADDLEAMLIAEAALRADGGVVSITYDGQHQREGAMVPSSKFVVWIRARDVTHVDQIDNAISAALARVNT